MPVTYPAHSARDIRLGGGSAPLPTTPSARADRCGKARLTVIGDQPQALPQPYNSCSLANIMLLNGARLRMKQGTLPFEKV
jgi:hypothetical protein